MLRACSPLSVDRDERVRDRVLRRYARWRRPEDLEALVVSYRPLARSLARRYATPPGSREDLEQAAYEGLIKAIHRFKPERGARFESFAVPTVLGEVRRYLRDTAWSARVPRSLQDRAREVRSAAEGFSAVHGRAPTARELARALGCDDETVAAALGVASSLSVVSPDAPALQAGAATASAAEQLGADDPGYDRVECLAAIEESLPALTSGQKTVLRLHFGEDLTQRQIAAQLGRSRSEVARDLGEAVARLRAVAA
jgi:RNA polymerase sigma-B factor